MKNRDKAAEELDAISLELVRAAELELLGSRTDESAVLLRSLWKLQNPLGLDSRKQYSETVRETKNGRTSTVVYTAHTHTDEAMRESPDDLLLYRRAHRQTGASKHYIVDRLDIREVSVTDEDEPDEA